MKSFCHILVGVFLVTSFMTFSFSARAQSVKFKGEMTMADNLKVFLGSKKRITVNLNNGVSYTGVLSEVGSHFIILSQLGSGKDFFDALIKLDDISALEAQIREK